MNRHLIILTFLLSLFYTLLPAQNYRPSHNVHFGQSTETVEVTLGDNADELEKLSSLLEEIKANSDLHLIMVELSGYASPEGSKKRNDEITLKRLKSVENYLKTNLKIPDNLIKTVNHGVGWDDLSKLVSNSNMEYKDEVLSILENTRSDIWWRDGVANSRNKQLMELGDGQPYLYMLEYFFPKLRKATITVYYQSDSHTPVLGTEESKYTLELSSSALGVLRELINDSDLDNKEEILHILDNADKDVYEKKDTQQRQTRVKREPKTKEPKEIKKVKEERAPLGKLQQPVPFRLKTNLLYWAALAPNIAFEYHFLIKDSHHFSVGASFLMPWWSNKENHQYYQIMRPEIGIGYHFGRKQGHHVGINFQGGMYSLKSGDINKTGKIGEFGGVGLEYGYTLPIAKNLALDFEVGLGYVHSRYQEYQVGEDNLLFYLQREDEYKKANLFVPSVGVSLVWNIGKIKN